MLKKIGIFSADPDQNNGQALVTKRVASLFPKEDLLTFYYKSGAGASMYSAGKKFFLLWFHVLKGELEVLYIVCSRSIFGFLRDIPAYLTTFLGIPLVVHIHGSNILCLLKIPIVGVFLKFFLNRATVLVPSQHLLPELKSYGLVNVILCENFSSPRFDQVDELLRRKNKTEVTNILWNSNVMASKGIFLLADAIDNLIKRGYLIKLTIIGNCLADEFMSEAICRSRLGFYQGKSWVYYLGPLPQHEVVRLIFESDIICLPSVYASECQPLAVIDAMCAGRKVLVSNSAALKATVESYPAELVDPMSVISIQNGLINLMNKVYPDDELSAAIECARSRFSKSRFDSQIRKILLGTSN